MATSVTAVASLMNAVVSTKSPGPMRSPFTMRAAALMRMSRRFGEFHGSSPTGRAAQPYGRGYRFADEAATLKIW